VFSRMKPDDKLNLANTPVTLMCSISVRVYVVQPYI